MVREHTLSLSASIGVTLYPQDDEDADTLVRHADQAMYVAKQRGRNRYHLFDVSQEQELKATHQTVARVRRALNNHELCLYYQQGQPAQWPGARFRGLAALAAARPWRGAAWRFSALG